MSLTDLPQVQSLSIRDKLQLVDDLLKSMASDLDAMEVSQGEQELLDERWVSFLQDPSAALTVDRFKQELEALRA